MTDAMEVLFNYAQEHTVRPLLNQEHGYAAARLCADQQIRRLRLLLAKEAWEYLSELLDQQNQLIFFHERALFHAGFRLSMELAG